MNDFFFWKSILKFLIKVSLLWEPFWEWEFILGRIFVKYELASVRSSEWWSRNKWGSWFDWGFGFGWCKRSLVCTRGSCCCRVRTVSLAGGRKGNQFLSKANQLINKAIATAVHTPKRNQHQMSLLLTAKEVRFTYRYKFFKLYFIFIIYILVQF